MCNFYWKIKEEKTKKILIWLHYPNPKQQKKAFTVKIDKQKLIDCEENNGILTEDLLICNINPDLYRNLVLFFRSLDEIDLLANEKNFDTQTMSDLSYINDNKYDWKLYLSEHLKEQIINNELTDFLELILISRFLISAHLLSDPFIMKGITDVEVKNFKLMCHTYRMIVLEKMLNHSYISNDIEYKKIILKAFINEYERFVDFVSSNNFNSYLLPEDLKSMVLTFSNSNGSSEVDDLVHYIVAFFSNSIKENEIHLKHESSLKERLVRLKSRMIRTFYLPRFSVKESRRYLKELSLVDRVNIFAPRLFASIIIGYIPIVLTGEINTWAYEFLTSYKNDFNIFNLWGFLLAWLIPIVTLILCRGYISIEIENILGYRNASTKQKANYLFMLGLIYSFFISLIGHIIFTRIYNIAEGKIYTKNPIWDTFNIFPELLFVQMGLAFFLGLIIQTIWEDKPITQPL